MLGSEEYIEQAYLFRALAERIRASEPVQETLRQLKQEILATTKLPLAIDFLLAELNHAGSMATAMERMAHYFAPFQTFLVTAAEAERGRFDMPRAMEILQAEAEYRSTQPGPVGLFFYQFEALCRNRLAYDHGLAAMAKDPVYDERWKRWLLAVRHQLGLIDIADLVYVHSAYYLIREQQAGRSDTTPPDPLLFGEKEGRIALANRRKEPLYFFSALQRQLRYPAVPRPKVQEDPVDQYRKLVRQVERMETRIKLLEDEQRTKGIDLSKFFGQAVDPPRLDGE
ncbi:MAG: hypothetical protein ACK493_17080 [Planctomycetota bacterium]|jgi:hypothetical protein|nr:hypothetical protein [Blastopirellula sp.]